MMAGCSLIKMRRKKEKTSKGKLTLGLIRHYPMMPPLEYLTKSGLS